MKIKNLKNRYLSIILGGYIIFLIFLLSTGAIKKFINPKLSFLSLLSIIILTVMLIYNFKNSRQSKPEPDCDGHYCHHSHGKFEKGSLILLVPLLLSMFIAPETLSYQPSTISNSPTGNQPVQLKSSLGMKVHPDTQIVPPGYQEYTQLNIGDIIFDTLKPPKQKLINSKIFLQGIVLNSPKFKDDEIAIYRIVISCCAADGVPLGVQVKLPENVYFKDGDWIGVEGSIQLIPFKDGLKEVEPIAYMVTPEKIYPYFTALKAYKLITPADQYLFP